MKLYRILELNRKFYPEYCEDGGTVWNKMPGMPVRYTLQEAKHYIACSIIYDEKQATIHNYP